MTRKKNKKKTESPLSLKGLFRLGLVAGVWGFMAASLIVGWFALELPGIISSPQFERKAAQLITHPRIGRGGRVENTRELVVRPNYLLIYDIEGETVRILRVLHAAQQWPPERQ